jgi:hypothetical protein
MRPMSNNPSGIEPPKSGAKTAAPQSPLQFFSLSHTEKCWMIRRKAGEVGANVTLRQAQMWPLSHLHWYRFVTGIAGQVIFFLVSKFAAYAWHKSGKSGSVGCWY